MKKNLTAKILCTTLAALLFAVGVAASSNSRTIDIFFRNIKIMIDGAEYIPTDADGKTVEPFIYNGTTYLPVRAVATAFDKDVEWDGKNAVVYLGKKDKFSPDNRLDKIMYTDYRENDSANGLEIINGTVTDYNGKIYTNGILFWLYEGKKTEVDYPLNGQYSVLTGTVVLPQSVKTNLTDGNTKVAETDVVIYDEDVEIFRINGVTASMPYKFEVPVTGVNSITVSVETERYSYTTRSFVLLTDLALYK